ncbi:uncharacterized protein LOC100544327 [Meleagris gallopavo]|uniref:uncharacterized protein LOC100544327 n=1 Tax=Meleagris gallopavo TaxID=9103 RepID=UPI0012AC2BCB|nr:uncharacterized protein LOC100544327 [Meleagris gallopavo]
MAKGYRRLSCQMGKKRKEELKCIQRKVQEMSNQWVLLTFHAASLEKTQGRDKRKNKKRSGVKTAFYSNWRGGRCDQNMQTELKGEDKFVTNLLFVQGENSVGVHLTPARATSGYFAAGQGVGHTLTNGLREFGSPCPPFCVPITRRGGDSNPRSLRPSPPPFAGGVTCPPRATVCRLCAAVRVRVGTAGAGGAVLPGCRAAMSEKGELDLTGAKQNTGMWLVKVPKYLSQQWSKASGRGEVGKLRIAKNQGRTEVSFTLNEELASISDIGGKPASVSAPREHPFLLQSVGGQTLTVFTESSTENQSEEKSESSSYGECGHFL